jgi:transposase
MAHENVVSGVGYAAGRFVINGWACAADPVFMYITVVPNRGAKPTTLLRQSYREDKRVKNRTLANLSHLPPYLVETLRRAMQGDPLMKASEAFAVTGSEHHGHVEVVLAAMERLGFARLVASERSRERDLVLGMVAARLINPTSKLATTRWWSTTSLPTELAIADATEKDLYAALDWLEERQEHIEKKLAKRHLTAHTLVLYDITSTWMEGTECPLAKRGYSRDGKKNTLQIIIGLLTDRDGRPVSIEVFAGNTADSTTVMGQVAKLQERFGLERVVIAGDRGMVTSGHVEQFAKAGSVDWISALKSGAIRKLVSRGALQMELFDERNLVEVTSEDHPGERLVACRNPELAKRRARKRQELIAATLAELAKIKVRVDAGRLSDKADIGLRVGRVIDRYKVAKHIDVTIDESSFRYSINDERVAAEAALDGIYVIRTSVAAEGMSAEDVVRSYKRLTRVERAFRSMKTVDLEVRPIHHRLEGRVRAHVFLCMLAYYVEWHLRRAWAPLLFDDELDSSDTRDPVDAAQRSPEAKRKAKTKRTADGETVQSFATLMTLLGSVVRNTCRRAGAASDEPTFTMATQPTTTQRRALELARTISAIADA